MEHAAGREREQLEGWVPELASDAEVREALEKAFDYRGDVTITQEGWNDKVVKGIFSTGVPGGPHLRIPLCALSR